MFEWLRVHIISREDAEFLFFVAQTAISIIAIIALLYARAQVAEAKINTTIIAQQAQANSLLSLEQRWNSDQVREARKCLVGLASQLRQEVFKEHNHLNDDAAMQKVQSRFTDELSKLMKEDLTGRYVVVLRVFGFFETVGLLVRRGYVSIEDIDLLSRAYSRIWFVL